MKLSPLDIQHQEFDSAVSGYKKKQVREFLERVADAFEELLRDNQDLHGELEAQSERLEELQVGELELRRAVVSAERIGNEMKEQAQREVELMVQEGKARRDGILRDAETQLQALRAELTRTEREHKLFREQFRGMLRAYERSLDNQPELVQSAPKPAQAGEEGSQHGSDTEQSAEQAADRRVSGASVILEPND